MWLTTTSTLLSTVRWTDLICGMHISTGYICTNEQCLSQFVCSFVFSATAPSGPRPPHPQGLYITHNDAPQWVGLLWTSDQLVAETSDITQQTDIHACEEIRTQNPSKPAAADLRLRSRGHWDRHLTHFTAPKQCVFQSSQRSREQPGQLSQSPPLGKVRKAHTRKYRTPSDNVLRQCINSSKNHFQILNA